MPKFNAKFDSIVKRQMLCLDLDVCSIDFQNTLWYTYSEKECLKGRKSETV
ncbi:MAG: hypothetical protein J6Q67_08705 [Clostridia bacterium]|nr:hypothetical protein [Clostridia bacterium]